MKTTRRSLSWLALLGAAALAITADPAAAASAARKSRGLFSTDFAGGAGSWTVASGTFQVEGGVYRSRSLDNERKLSRAVVGDAAWKDYRVVARLKLEQTASPKADYGVIARYIDPNNYYIFLYKTGEKKITIETKIQGKLRTIAEAPLELASGQWHDFQVTVSAASLAVAVDGKPLAAATHGDFKSGPAGLLAYWADVQCSRFSVEPVSAPLTRLKPLFPATPLARNGVSSALVLAGDGEPLAALGREVAAKLSRRSGATIEALSAGDVVSRWWEIDFDRIAGRNVIAIGNINNHRLLAALWGEGYTAEDAMFPGAGGHVVRSVHDPFGRRFNVIVLAGSEIEGIRRATEAFLTRHLVEKDGSTLVPQPVLEVVPGTPRAPYVGRTGKAAPAKPARTRPRPAEQFAAELDAMVAQDRSRTNDPAKRSLRTLVNVTAPLATLAQAWFKTGDPGLPPLMKQLIDRHRDLLKIAPERVEMEGASASHAIWWDIVEELPVWTDQDRLDVTNAFLRDARQGFEHGPAYDRVEEGYVQVVEENHGTFSATNLLNAWSYFDKYYDLPDTAYWMSVVRATFAGQLASHQILEDAAGYLQFSPGHNVAYAFKTRDMRYIQLGIARTHLDYMMQAAHNNLGLLSGFGDTAGLLPHGHVVFGRLAWFLRDPQAAWWVRDHLPNDCGIETYSPEIPWDFDLPTAPPADWDGVKVFPLYRQALGFERASTTFFTTPAESAGPEWFNKIVFREGTRQDGQYLLLDGAAAWTSTPGFDRYPPGPLGHNHRDLNTIINFTDRGRMWLVDHTYEARGVADHSGLVITRDGLLRYQPHQVRLRALAQSARLAVVRTHYEDYSDASWERAIFWLRGDYFVVFDRVVATQAGDFAVRSNLRGLGEDKLDPSGLWLEQKGKWCRIIPDGGAQAEVVDVPFKEAARWKPYPFARPVAKSLLQFKAAHLEAGQAINFVSLLAAGDSREELANLKMEAAGDTGVRVGAGPTIAACGFGAPPGVEADLAAHAIAGRDVLLAGVSRLGSEGRPVLLARPAVQLAADGEKIWIEAAEPAQLDLPLESAQERRQVPAGRHELTAASLRTFVDTLTREAPRPPAAASIATTLPRGAGAPSAAAVPPALGTSSRRVGTSAHRVLLADLDGDGQEEWLVAGAEGLAVQNASGRTAWTFRTRAACRALDAADLDGDGRREIALGCDDAHVYLLGPDGRERWHFKSPPTARSNPPAIDRVQIVDLDGDDTPEIIASGNWIHCLTSNGKVKWEKSQIFARGQHAGDAHAFVVQDYDGDGRRDVMVAYRNNYSPVMGYDGGGRQNFPVDLTRAKHGGPITGWPHDLALVELPGDGGRPALVVANDRDLSIRRVDPAHEWSAEFSESGNFTTLATWTPANRTAIVFGATDMGAVFAFHAVPGTVGGASKFERRWVRSVGTKIQCMIVSPVDSPAPALWIGTVSGSVIRLDALTGKPRAATKDTGSPVLQFVAAPGVLHAVHADGHVETLALPEYRQTGTTQ